MPKYMIWLNIPGVLSVIALVAEAYSGPTNV